MDNLKIAFHGYARTGKDTVGEVLMKRHHLKRVAFGDIIKDDLDELIWQHFGFSAFTENDDEKELIRQVLVHWGFANYRSIERRFFRDLPSRAINTRIFRPRECEQWRKLGGYVILLERPGAGPREPAESEAVAECKALGLIDAVVINDRTPEDAADLVELALGVRRPRLDDDGHRG